MGETLIRRREGGAEAVVAVVIAGTSIVTNRGEVVGRRGVVRRQWGADTVFGIVRVIPMEMTLGSAPMVERFAA